MSSFLLLQVDLTAFESMFAVCAFLMHIIHIIAAVCVCLMHTIRLSAATLESKQDWHLVASKQGLLSNASMTCQTAATHVLLMRVEFLSVLGCCCTLSCAVYGTRVRFSKDI